MAQYNFVLNFLKFGIEIQHGKVYKLVFYSVFSKE